MGDVYVGYAIASGACVRERSSSFYLSWTRISLKPEFVLNRNVYCIPGSLQYVRAKPFFPSDTSTFLKTMALKPWPPLVAVAFYGHLRQGRLGVTAWVLRRCGGLVYSPAWEPLRGPGSIHTRTDGIPPLSLLLRPSINNRCNASSLTSSTSLN